MLRRLAITVVTLATLSLAVACTSPTAPASHACSGGGTGAGSSTC